MKLADIRGVTFLIFFGRWAAFEKLDEILFELKVQYWLQ
jgi:hypothetical protein